MKNLNVSVGVSAYNEQNNIKNVLNDILAQIKSGWNLKEILIYSDGSKDATISEIKKVKSRYIKIYEFKKRAGKTFRLAQMFKEFEGDVLVMFDADVKLAGGNVVSNLIKSFEDKKVMLIGGNSTPYPPKTFFERAIYSTFSVFYNSRKKMKYGNNIFGCTGSILAIRKSLAKKIKLPKVINEDAYIYLYCIREGLKFKYEESAKVYYKLPDNLGDYLRQLFRSTPEAVNIELKKYFGNLVEKEFSRPFRFYFLSIFEVLMKNPFELIFVSIINLLAKPFYPLISKNYKIEWFTAKSTH